jgi:hypothetical protein
VPGPAIGWLLQARICSCELQGFDTTAEHPTLDKHAMPLRTKIVDLHLSDPAMSIPSSSLLPLSADTSRTSTVHPPRAQQYSIPHQTHLTPYQMGCCLRVAPPRRVTSSTSCASTYLGICKTWQAETHDSLVCCGLRRKCSLLISLIHSSEGGKRSGHVGQALTALKNGSAR